MMKEILTVGYHKGEMDFGVNASIRDLSYEEMSKFREMLVVAIGQAERMWSENAPKPTTNINPSI